MKSNFRQYWIHSSEELIDIANQGWAAIEEMLKGDQVFLKALNLIAFEEINSGQSIYEMETVPLERGVPKATLVGSTDGDGKAFGHFRNLQMFTHHIIKGLMGIQSPYQPSFRVIVTAHENDRIERAKGASKGLTGPALATTAAVSLVGACSFAFGCKRLDGLTAKSPTKWYFVFSENDALYRMRGEGWPRRMLAEPSVLWSALEGKINPKDIPANLLD